MFTKEFWKRTIERAIKTGAQAFLAVGIVGSTVTSTDWVSVRNAGVTALLAVVLSIVTSLGSADFGPPDDPSVV